MNETKNQLIQTGFTLDRLHQDKKISDEAYTILKDRNKQAINYSQCCETLPSKEIIDYLERQEDFYIDEDEMANRFYNSALNDVKYFINKRKEELK